MTKIAFDTQIFAIDTIKKAAYKFSNKFTVDFQLEGSVLSCTIQFMNPVDDIAYIKIIQEFKNEVLDQDLREKIRSETAPIRNVVLAHAFSKTGLVTDD